jgi:hypothetical protein
MEFKTSRSHIKLRVYNVKIPHPPIRMWDLDVLHSHLDVIVFSLEGGEGGRKLLQELVDCMTIAVRLFSKLNASTKPKLHFGMHMAARISRNRSEPHQNVLCPVIGPAIAERYETLSLFL